MLDEADLAILETHLDVMSPCERGLVEEVRRLRDEAGEVAVLEGQVLELEGENDNLKSDLESAQDDIKRLESELAASETQARAVDIERDRAVAELADLKREFRALLKIPSWVEEVAQ